MTQKDLHNNIKILQAISPQSSSGDTPIVSTIIDTQGYNSAEFLILTGSIGDANATFTVLVEDGDTKVGADTLSDAAAVDDIYLLGTEALASFQYDDDNEVRKIGYTGNKRYLRLTITPSGNSGTPSAAFLAAIAVLSHAGTAATSNP